MRRVAAFILAGTMLMGSLATAEPDYAATIKAIGEDIAALQREFRQLREFSVKSAVMPEVLEISYQYHTHKPPRRAGWRANVPDPDDDGIWFYINFHDADSKRDIDLQPMEIVKRCIGEKRVTFLIQTGKKAEAVVARISAVLASHGVKTCGK